MSLRIQSLFKVKGLQEAFQGLAILMATVGAVISSMLAHQSDPTRSAALMNMSDAEIDKISLIVNKQRAQIDALSRYVDATSHRSKVNNVSMAKLAKMQSEIDDISRRQNAIEQVILTNPGKALEIPMLRKDIEGIKQNDADALQNIQHSTDRLYDLNKYVVLTIFASIVLLAISAFIRTQSS